jgi:hypothetical protein
MLRWDFCVAAFFFVLLAKSASATQPTPQEIAQQQLQQSVKHRALLMLKKDFPVAKLRLPEGCSIRAQELPLVAIVCREPTTKESLQALRKLDGVRSAEAVHVETALQSTGHAGPGTGALLPERPYMPSQANSGAYTDSGSCRLTAACPDGRSQFWAQERVGGDLMFRELNRMGIRPGSAHVAVVDSGFDATRSAALMGSPGFRVAKGWDGAGPETKDTDGHGTAVAGLIGGKDGVGLAPNAKLTVYRVTGADEAGTTSSDNLKMSIMRACNEGAEVINVSWGGMFDEMAIFEEERSQSAFYSELASKGCLVVKSAGNDARRISRSAMNADDALLRVEASEASGRLASFSSNGEIAAPGHSVFTLKSQDSARSTRSSSFCGQHSGNFANGTSFSAPITAAVAVQVVSVLKTSSAYAALAGPERVKLLNRILIGSTKGRQLDSLRAVLAAEVWAKSGSREVPTALQVAADFRASQRQTCQQPIASCPGSGCVNRVACAVDQRRHMSLCDPPRSSVVQDFLSASSRAESAELSFGALEMASPHAARSAVEAASLLDGQGLVGLDPAFMRTTTRRVWENLHARWSAGSGGLSANMSFDQALQALPYLLSSRSRVGNEYDADVALRDFLQSDGVRERITRGRQSGSDDDLSRVINALKQAKSTLGTDEVLKALRETYVSWTKPEELARSYGSMERLVATARLLDGLQRDAEFSQDARFKTYVTALERHLFGLVNTHKADSLPADMDFLDGLFSRNPDLLMADLRAADPKSLRSVYLVKKIDRVPEADRVPFLMKTIEAFSKEKNLSSGYGKTLETATEKLGTEIGRLPPSERSAAVERYWAAMEAGTEAYTLDKAFPSNFNGYYYGESRRRLESDPLMQNGRLQAYAASVLERMKDATFRAKTGYAIKYLFNSAYGLLAKDPAVQADLPLHFKNALSDWKKLPRTDPVQKFRLKSSGDSVLSLLGNKDALSHFWADATVQAALQDLLRDAESNPAKYDGEQIRDLKRKVEEIQRTWQAAP